MRGGFVNVAIGGIVCVGTALGKGVRVGGGVNEGVGVHVGGSDCGGLGVFVGKRIWGAAGTLSTFLALTIMTLK